MEELLLMGWGEHTPLTRMSITIASNPKRSNYKPPLPNSGMETEDLALIGVGAAALFLLFPKQTGQAIGDFGGSAASSTYQAGKNLGYQAAVDWGSVFVPSPDTAAQFYQAYPGYSYDAAGQARLAWNTSFLGGIIPWRA